LLLFVPEDAKLPYLPEKQAHAVFTGETNAWHRSRTFETGEVEGYTV